MTTPDGETALVPQFLDLREYERLQLLQMNGGGVGAGPGAGAAMGAGMAPAGQRGPQADFEETIHRVSTPLAAEGKG